MKKPKKAFDRLVREADRLLLTPYEKLSKKNQKVWMDGTKRLLKDIRKAGGRTR